MYVLIFIILFFSYLFAKRIEPFENYDTKYVKLYNKVFDTPDFYQYQMKQLITYSNMTDSSTVLQIFSQTSFYLKELHKLKPNISITGLDSKPMIQQGEINLPTAKYTSINPFELNQSYTHILLLQHAGHNYQKEYLSKLLNLLHKHCTYLCIHLYDNQHLDPAPKDYSEYFQKDGYKKSLTYFKGFTHIGWWENIGNDMYQYCQKFIFPDETFKIKVQKMWIPDRKFLISFIQKHNFHLHHIIFLDNFSQDFNLYIFKHI